jgi:polyisoprenoid-binding protein YceI
MSYRKLALAAAVLAAGAAPAAAQQVVPAQSEIAFVTKQMGVPVEGKFRKWSAVVAFDPKKPENGTVNFSIEAGSAAFGSPEVDVEVPKPGWLSAAKFPIANFVSTGIKPAGPGKFNVAGKLSIKGSTRDVVVPVALTQAGAASTATGTFTIKRLAFKIGENEWADTSMVADDVQVKFKLALTGMGPL